MLRTGSRGGFTLVEAMVSVAILSFGIVMLYHSFFICADASRTAANLLNARLWIDGKIGQEKETLFSAQAFAYSEESGNFTFDARNYAWQKSIQPVDDGLYSLLLSLSWKEAGRQRVLTGATYLALHE